MTTTSLAYSADQHLRVLTLWQPWASLVAWGEKQWETRSHRFPRYVGWVAIHAAKGPPRGWSDMVNDSYFLRAMGRHRVTTAELPRGKVLAIVWLDPAIATSSAKAHLLNIRRYDEIEFGDYGVDRLAIPMQHLQPLREPIAFANGQGLRTAPPELRALIAEQLQGVARG